MTTPLLVVSVGSDHHPFDRLIRWVDNWIAVTGPESVRCVMQFGTASTPCHGEGGAFMPHAALLQLLERADIVVTQGGPMGIVEARRCGTKPIVVPRTRLLGEVVDDHQFEFCRKLGAGGLLVLAEDEQQLHAALDAALSDPRSLVVFSEREDAVVEQSVRRFAELVAELPDRRSLVSRLRRQPSTA